MLLGIDFDNTLVCYDGLFHAEAVERKMMPEDGPYDKQGVRRYLCDRGREDDFTLLQGAVYGPGMKNAEPYPGLLKSLHHLKNAGFSLCVISHKTKTPVLGPPYDLRAAAFDWLARNKVIEPGPVARNEVFFEDTLEKKAVRVAERSCTHFIDDLAKFFNHPQFPSGVRKILFQPRDPDAYSVPATDTITFSSWSDITGYLETHC